MKIKITILLITILSIYGVFNYVRNSPVEHTAVEMIESKDFYTQNVQPIFDAKCIACHACYNSPCQLNLTSYTGTMRGGNKVSLYDFPKFKSRNPTRLFVDAVDENGWREKGFYKVYNTKDEKKSILNHMIFNLEGIESGKQDQYTSEESRECISDLSGHGIGREFHEEPQILHYGRAGTGIQMKAGMTFTVEPMINLGKRQCKLLKDGWTVITRDKKQSAQFEHTILITETGYEIMTLDPENPYDPKF